MTNPQDKAIEAGAIAMHCKDRPHDPEWQTLPEQTSLAYRRMARAAIAAYERAMWRVPVAWRYKSEAPGDHSEWSVTQFRADLDTLSKMPFMRVEPLYVLPPVPEGE